MQLVFHSRSKTQFPLILLSHELPHSIPLHTARHRCPFPQTPPIPPEQAAHRRSSHPSPSPVVSHLDSLSSSIQSKFFDAPEGD
ncbi:hypothetical protein ACLOJK_026213 [Asimina triloba]